MKNRNQILLSVFLLIVTLVIPAQAKEIINAKTNNGCFEDGMQGWLCHAFGNYSAKGEIIESTKKDPAPDGKKYLSITAEAGTDTDLAIRATNRVKKMKFKKGQKLVVTAQIRTRALDEFAVAHFIIVFYKKGFKNAKVKPGKLLKLKDTKWTELTGEFTIDEKRTAEPFEVRVVFRSRGKLEAGKEAVGYVDNLVVKLEKK